MDHRAEAVIAFWFGAGPAPTREIYDRWFRKDPALDVEIRRRFGALHDDAAAGRLEAWRGHARGELALVVLLDQFSRNMFRDDPRAFENDAYALSIARDLRRSGRTHELSLHQQLVALMPFVHAEELSTQQEGVAAFSVLVAEANEVHAGDDVIGMLANSHVYAEKHREIIERFGRFPHRNAVLARESTFDELAFLAQPGSRF
jgi:uncharacterized protein (DUF924 family)